MNDTFNFKRFGWLFKKTLLERPVQMTGLVSSCAGYCFIDCMLFAKSY